MRRGPSVDASDEQHRGDPGEESGWHTTWRDLGAGERRVTALPAVQTTVRDGVRFVELAEAEAASETAPDEAESVAAAEDRLMKALRARSLSVSEARARLRQADLPGDAVEEVLDRLERIGALDDARLAEQLVHTATTRKGQGRRAIAQTLTGRGIPRDLADAIVAELPDDDAERALEFARTKARALVRYDDETALRRLVGQLGRRGFGGGLAMSVARQALEEGRRGSSGVRFR